ncbi:hypothetical protein THF1A12_420022 [Vibrio jasicida]|uniref:Response regulatory domain-containing protein n=1 Tax=Vibrio jasicida TaxID=766224 RepID=A0AAU9QU80_9VIBR|nr:hypothetical protein THF1A12_420022 [Vibrio jasicida]
MTLSPANVKLVDDSPNKKTIFKNIIKHLTPWYILHTSDLDDLIKNAIELEDSA